MNYQYICESCKEAQEISMRVEDRYLPESWPCPNCSSMKVKKCIGNSGGFRLGPHGNVGWSNDGYATTYGDSEIFKARAKGQRSIYEK